MTQVSVEEPPTSSDGRTHYATMSLCDAPMRCHNALMRCLNNVPMVSLRCPIGAETRAEKTEQSPNAPSPQNEVPKSKQKSPTVQYGMSLRGVFTRSPQFTIR
jgi:hypothetical protein